MGDYNVIYQEIKKKKKTENTSSSNDTLVKTEQNFLSFISTVRQTDYWLNGGEGQILVTLYNLLLTAVQLILQDLRKNDVTI